MAKRSTNFSDTERQFFSELVRQFPIIQDKRKTAAIEALKAQTWTKLKNQFNSNENVHVRSEETLKVRQCFLFRDILTGTEAYERGINFYCNIRHVSLYDVGGPTCRPIAVGCLKCNTCTV